MACLIDLHTHTFPASGCSRMTIEELIEAAIQAGLDGVAVTDHLVVEGAAEAQAIGSRKYGFAVFRGVEAHVAWLGDLLVYGYSRNVEPGIAWGELRQRVELEGGALVLAHPFRGGEHGALWGYLQRKGWPAAGGRALAGVADGLAAIEAINGGCRAEVNAEAARLARALSLPGVGGSDAHAARNVGRAATWFPEPIRSDAELVAALKRGGYRAMAGKGCGRSG